MKRLYVQIAASCFPKTAVFTSTLKSILLTFVLGLAWMTGRGAVVVSPASGGANICSTVATSPTTLGVITITESATNDFPNGSSQLVLATPAGWSFVASLPTIVASGGDVSIGVVSITPSTLTINFSASGTTHIDAVTITGLQVTAASGSSLPGYIYAQSDLGITGITTSSTGTDFGNLAIVSAVAPAVSIAATATTICATTGVTFNPTPTNGGASPTYQWYVNGSFVGASTFFATSTLSNGNTVYCVMTPTAGGCYTPATATSNTITMTVNPQPTAVTVSGGGTYCGSTTITAANGGSGTIYYQGTTSGGTSTATPASSELISSSGTYYFNAQSGAGCWSTEGSAAVVINPLPSAVTVTGGGTFCGGTTTLNASNLGDGTIYYQGVTSNGTSVATPSVTQVVAASGTYYFRAESGLGCWGTQGSAVVTINPIPPAVVVSTSGTYCGNTTLTAVNGGVGTIYYQGTTSGGTSTATPSSSQLISASGTYYFNAQSGAGCWGTQGSATVTINTAATANAGLPQSICAGSTTALSGSIGGSATTVTWSAPSGTFSNVNSLTSTYTPTIGSGSVTLTLTTNDPDGAGPCSPAVSTVVITVNPQPTVVTVTGGGTYCGTGTLTAANGGSGTIYYEGTTSNGTSVATASSSQAVSATGIYYFRALSGGCWGPQGSAAVTINPTPNVYNVTGGGGYCTGSTGSDVGLSNSDAGVNYQLYKGGVATGSAMAGTNAPLDFGLQTTAATYTIVGTNPVTGCTANMTGSAVVAINPLPTQYSVTGTGSYCAGGLGLAVGLSGSAVGVTYQLYLAGSTVGAAVSGTGSPITFGNQTAAGTYTVVARITATGCTNNMLGSAIITINPAPATFSVTGGGAYCSGGTGLNVGLAGSAAGVSYQLYKGGALTGLAIAGTGAALNFGLETSAATYTVIGTNTTTLCTSNMTGSAVITITPPPTAYTVTGGGSFCAGGAGMPVGTSGSDVGTNYQLYVGGVPVGTAVAGTGSALAFGNQTTAGTYTVIGTNTASLCTGNMTGSVLITVNAVPTTFTITGGGSYCTGGAGLALGLSGSQVGVTYQLYNTFVPVGSAIAGTGGALNFGLQTAAGFYTVLATNTTTTCATNISSGVAITILPLPTAYAVTGGGGYCVGGTGVHVGLASSDVGVNYLLYLGAAPVGTPVAGTGTALDFGLQTTAGTYTVIATSASTTCVNNMTGSVVITINPLPGLFNVTGGGAYCAGGTGVHVGLSGSAAGIDYQLFVGGVATGAPVAGTGAALDFGLQTTTGSYTVVATNATTTCSKNMTGSVNISTNPVPVVEAVTGGGNYCAGGAGLTVDLAGSVLGVNYQLVLGTTPVSTMGGTGSSFSFGPQTAAGTYTVIATTVATGCSDTMGSTVITITSLPTVYTLSGGGAYCAGASGVDVSLGGSDTGVNYQLYVGGVPTGSIVAGTGLALDFGMQTTAGTYTCVATNATAGCTNNMTGAPVVTITAAPAIFAMAGGGAYCVGGAGVDVRITGSTVGVNYQLYNGATVVGAPMSGTGSALDWGMITTAGTYTVVASTAALSCTSIMSGSDVVSVSAYPVVGAISGPTRVCTGANITLSDTSAGGAWTSGTPGTATAAAGGVVTGVSAGTANISYTVANAAGCATSVTTNITVSITPTVNAVIGAGNVCNGATTPFTDATTGGSWTSSNIAVATVGSTGIVTGVGSGSAAISYTVAAAGCSATAIGIITVGGGIAASVIIPGAATLCMGNPVGLTVRTAGGGAGLTYQWYDSSTVIAGAVDSTDTVRAPGLYSVSISNGTCSMRLAGVSVVAAPNPIISLDTIPNLLFTGSFVTYQWLLNGAPIAGATSNNTPQMPPLGNSYQVVVADANGCVDTSAAFIVIDTAFTGIPVIATGYQVTIYPNPASSVIYIDAPVKTWVSIASPDGALLIDRKEAVSVNVGQLADGMYLIMVYDEHNNLIKAGKFVKMQ